MLPLPLGAPQLAAGAQVQLAALNVVADSSVSVTDAPAPRGSIWVAANDRGLVKNQGTAAQNGIYIVSASSWTRATDMDAWTEVPSAFTFVEQGTTNADTSWVCTSNQGGTLGSTAIDFANKNGL